MTDDPVRAAGPLAAGTLWAELLAAHPRTGLWPLLLTGLAPPPDPGQTGLYAEKQRDDAHRPWHVGELAPIPASRIDGEDPAQILAAQWADVVPGRDYGPGEAAPDPVPYASWPGLAGPGDGAADPDQVAAGIAAAPGGVQRLTGHDEDPYLGLTQAADGAAFCPDLRSMTTFSEYAESLVGHQVWNFWWD